MNKRQSTPDTARTQTVEEVRVSMLRWFAATFGDDYSVEDWRTFKAHLYPEAIEPMPMPVGPDEETQWENRYGQPSWR